MQTPTRNPQLTASSSIQQRGDAAAQQLPQNTRMPNCEWPRSSIYRAFIGIDNGFSGAIARLFPNGGVIYKPVGVEDLGKERLLHLEVNQAILREMVKATGVGKQNLLVAYEQCQPNPRFGARNCFTNGKNGEFWRLLLAFEALPSRCVNPQQWQRWMFRGIRGKDTKAMASLVRRQRFPTLTLQGCNKTQIEGINDALCIALWASELFGWLTQTPGVAAANPTDSFSAAVRCPAPATGVGDCTGI